MFGYIYRITNKVNGKTYIGQHKSETFEDIYMGSGKILKQAFSKYGIENFSKTIITIGMSRMELDVLEKFYIEKERKENLKGCYNITDGGTGGDTSKFIDYSKVHTLESNIKQRQAHLGKKFSEETKRKMSESHKGKPHPWNKAYNKGKHIEVINGKRVFVY